MGGLYGNAAATALEDLPEEARGLMSGILQQGVSNFFYFYFLLNRFSQWSRTILANSPFPHSTPSVTCFAPPSLAAWSTQHLTDGVHCIGSPLVLPFSSSASVSCCPRPRCTKNVSVCARKPDMSASQPGPSLSAKARLLSSATGCF